MGDALLLLGSLGDIGLLKGFYKVYCGGCPPSPVLGLFGFRVLGFRVRGLGFIGLGFRL